MNRRSLLGSAIAWATLPLSAGAQPQDAGMTATLNLPAQSGQLHGTFVFAEAGGPGMTARRLADFVDPRGAFVQTRVRVTRADFPGLRVEFTRMADRSWAGVEFWYGQIDVAPRNLPLGYTVTVTGDFSGSVTTPWHHCYARWRMTGNKAKGLRAGRNDWPYPMTAYADLVADRLIPDADPSLKSTLGGDPGLAAAYTPMGSSSYTVVMGAAGGRPDIGLFNAWDGQLIASLSPTASSALRAKQPSLIASTLALAEAAASIPWCWFDAKNGCHYERIVNNVKGASPPNPPATVMQAVFTGSPGYYQFSSTGPSSPYLSDSVGGGVWYLPKPGITIPASGVATALLRSEYGMPAMPTALPRYVGTMWDKTPPAGLSFAWGDASTFTRGQPWQIETAHTPETGYIAYILWRDPWDLFSTQANAMFYAGPSGWYPAQIRQGAWDYRGAACAVAATPDNVPSWLLPKSTMLAWLNVLQDKCMQAVNGKTPYSTVFFVMEAIGGSGNDGADGPVCNTGENWAGNQWCNPWQNAYWAQAAAFCLLNRPRDAKALAIAKYLLTGIDVRYNGTSGWPNTLPTLEHMGVRAVSGGPLYTSLAAAWAGQKHYILTPHRIAETNAACKEAPLPTALVLNANSYDYPTHDFAALSIGVQAGLTQFRASRNYVAGPSRRYGAFESVKAWKQS